MRIHPLGQIYVRSYLSRGRGGRPFAPYTCSRRPTSLPTCRAQTKRVTTVTRAHAGTRAHAKADRHPFVPGLSTRRRPRFEPLDPLAQVECAIAARLDIARVEEARVDAVERGACALIRALDAE